MRVCVIGAGYVGTVTGACLAHIGNDVIGLELDSAKTAKLSAGELPFVEPDCQELLEQGLASGRLRFTTVPDEALSDAEVIFVCVGTPLTESGEASTDALREAALSIAPHLRGDNEKIIITKSTVPVGSGDWVTMLIEDDLSGRNDQNKQVKSGSPDTKSAANFSVVSNPEFLREGCAVEDFLYPDRIVLGSSSATAINKVIDLYRPIIEQDFTSSCPAIAKIPVLTTTLESAELIKYAANAFLATKISFINEIAQICERVGGDIEQVAEGIGLDRRIGSSFLNAGIGWGGSCFRKDIVALKHTAEEYGYTPTMLDATLEVNDIARATVIRKLQDELKILKGKRIGLMGLSFKPLTDDLRDAPSLTLINRLHNSGARVTVFDPVVTDIGEYNDLARFASNMEELASGADALVLVTEWPEFCVQDWKQIAKVMRHPLIIDGRNALPRQEILDAGLQYVGIGR